MFHNVSAIPTGSPSLVDWLASNASDTKFIRPGRWIIPWTTLDSRSLFHFFRFKVQITILDISIGKHPMLICLPHLALDLESWFAYEMGSILLCSTMFKHTTNIAFIVFLPGSSLLDHSTAHEHGSQVFISKTFLREAFGKILHLHVACMCPDFDKTLNHLSCQIHHHPGIPMKSLNICGVPH